MANRKSEILNNFDMNALRLERARKAARGGTSLIDGLNQVAPQIAELKPGQTAKLAIPNYDTDPKGAVRKFVMAITAKTSNLVVQGGEWAGRTFDIANDGAGYLYVQRGNDLKGDKIPVRTRRGPGSKAKAATEAPSGEVTVSTVESGATVTENA